MAKRFVISSPAARADLRSIDRETARQILEAIDRYLDTGSATSSSSSLPVSEFRLRAGDYRVLFLRISGRMIEVLRVKHRSEAYR